MAFLIVTSELAMRFLKYKAEQVENSQRTQNLLAFNLTALKVPQVAWTLFFTLLILKRDMGITCRTEGCYEAVHYVILLLRVIIIMIMVVFFVY